MQFYKQGSHLFWGPSLVFIQKPSEVLHESTQAYVVVNKKYDKFTQVIHSVNEVQLKQGNWQLSQVEVFRLFIVLNWVSEGQLLTHESLFNFKNP